MVELWLSLNVLSFKLAWRPRQPQHPNERAAVDSMPVSRHYPNPHASSRIWTAASESLPEASNHSVLCTKRMIASAPQHNFHSKGDRPVNGRLTVGLDF